MKLFITILLRQVAGTLAVIAFLCIVAAICEADVIVRIRPISGLTPGRPFSVPVVVTTFPPQSIAGIQVAVEYDSTVVQFSGAEPSGVFSLGAINLRPPIGTACTDNLGFVVNRISIANAFSLVGASGDNLEVMRLQFLAVGDCGGVSLLRWSCECAVPGDGRRRWFVDMENPQEELCYGDPHVIALDGSAKITCPVTDVDRQPAPWGAVKELYR